MERPLKQIGDEIRELTDEEMIEYERDAAQRNPFIQGTLTDEAPASDDAGAPSTDAG